MGLNSGTRKVSKCFDMPEEYQDHDLMGSEGGDQSLFMHGGLGSTKRTTNRLMERRSSNKGAN